MAGLFGSSTTQQKPSLFGSLNTTPAADATPSPFAAVQSSNTGFGGGTGTQKPTLSLFGGSTQNAGTGNSLFSGSATNAGTGTNSLFGGNTTQNNPSGAGGLFGATQQPAQSSGLFGAAQQPAQSSGLFGAAQQPAQNTGTSSLFGQSLGQTNTGGGLFGQSLGQNRPAPGGLFGATAPAAATGNSLFGGATLGANAQPNTGGLFGQSTGNASTQQQQGQSLFGSLRGGGGVGMGGASQMMQPQVPQGASSVFGNSILQPVQLAPREKSIPDQMNLLVEKWNPMSPNCAFRHYFYNQVGEERAPYYGPGEGDDEQKWEDALKNRPNPASIPVLARGALELGHRLQTQALWVHGMQVRLHELDDMLTKRMQAHELQYSVRATEARRKHVVLSRRCLALATKVQVLRNRGYAMDGPEEQLKSKLAELQRVAFDPVMSGRQEEIWARLSVLRERAQQLKVEMENLSSHARGSGENPLDEDQMKKVEKLLTDYELQLEQLQKERESAEKDFVEWEATTKTRPLDR